MTDCTSCGTSNIETARFCNGCGARIGAFEPRRRLVTALFCDLVGSTGIGQRLDAEPLRAFLDEYFRTMAAVVVRHGGTVEKFIGDAVVGTFGIPDTHEDDAIRAVRAAVELLQAAEDLETHAEHGDISISVRVTVSSGEVFADEPSAESGSISGDVYNTAARLQSVAEPGQIVVAGSTEALLAGAAELVALGDVTLRGKSDPVAAYRVVRLCPDRPRSETPFVGRVRRLATLQSALDDALEAHACVLVTVLAGPGVGKSRLVAEFVDTARDVATVLIGQTPSYGEGVTFAALGELFTQAANSPVGGTEAVAARIGELLAREPDGRAIAARIAQMLGVGEAYASEASWAVRRLLEVLSASQPVVVVLEDLHWAEPPMLDLVDAVADRIHGPVLVICLARPELLDRRPTWGAGKVRSHTFVLPALASGFARHLAESLLGDDVPSSVIDRLCDVAEGNPLYLEQLAAMLTDQGMLVEGRWVKDSDESVVEIPTSLHALLAARLDQLDPTVRQVLELASIEGRRFRTEGLVAIAPEVEGRLLEGAISDLDRRDLIEPEDEASGEWRFVHALIRETAYRSLSKARRSELHERFAEWIATHDAGRPDLDEAVGRHLERAVHLQEEVSARDGRTTSLANRAGERLARAGGRAFAALDLLTSRDLLGRAERLLPERSSARLSMLPTLGVALTETGRPAESDALLTSAATQAREAGLERDALRLLVQLQANRVYRMSTESELEDALVETKAAAASLAEMGDDGGFAEAAVANEYLEWALGRVNEGYAWTRQAITHALLARQARETAQAAADCVYFLVVGPLPFQEFDEISSSLLLDKDDPIVASSGAALQAIAAIAARDAEGAETHQARWRQCIELHGLSWLAALHDSAIAQVELSMGLFEPAEQRLRNAQATLDDLGDVWWCETVEVLLCLAVAAQDRRREFLRLADALEQHPNSVPDRQSLVRAGIIRAQAQSLRGASSDAESTIRRTVELVQGTDLVLDHAMALTTLSDVLLVRNRAADAEEARGRATELLDAKGISRP